MPARFDESLLRRLKLRHLRVLIAVAREGSMGKAAVALAMSQPAVSKSVTELEQTLGVPVLERTPRGVTPTHYGTSLLKWALAVVDDLRQAAHEIELLRDPAAGEVRIGSTEPMVAGFTGVVIDRLSRQNPRLVFHVTQAPALTTQYRDLRERTVDLILGRMLVPIADADLDSETLFEDPLLIVAGTRNKWVRRSGIAPRDLVEESWVLPPHDTFAGARLAEAFRAAGVPPPRPIVSSNSIQLHTSLMATGRFLSVASGSTLRLSGRRLGMTALSVKMRIPPGPVGIITLKNRILSPVALTAIACARDVARTLARERPA
jgi:DNA-binding transcriptional LysR family regulator